MTAGYPDGVTAADIDAAAGCRPEPAHQPDPDAGYDEPESWTERDWNRAVGARSALMMDAARDEVAAEPPALEWRYGGWHMPADPVGEALAEAHGADRALRLLVRAALTIEPGDRAALLSSAIDAARSVGLSVARSRAWDMAAAAMRADRGIV